MSYQETDYKPLYKSMKRKLKLLIYENECFQEELRKAQRSLLRVQRDKSFLLDRIMQYQQGPESSSDSEQTDESDNENYVKDNKRRKVALDQSSSFVLNLQGNSKSSSSIKKKKTTPPTSLGSGVIVTKNVNLYRHGGKQTAPSSSSSLSSSGGSKGIPSHKQKTVVSQSHPASSNSNNSLALATSAPSATTPGTVIDTHQMSREEIERQLAARQPITDFSTTVSLTLPNQLFSDNLMEGDLMENDLETSPSNIGEDMNFESFD